uniref:Uncharacterized protein n=1 Tax=Anguilla anguilla TaxID=7936 RepID=A0A0E9VYB5_ANGAN
MQITNSGRQKSFSSLFTNMSCR